MLTDELIARRPSGRTGLANWYSEVFRAQDAEGLSVSDLAARLSVTPTNIYYWRRRLRELDAAAEGANPSPCGSGLVRVAVQPSTSKFPREEQPADLEVRLSNTRSIVVPPGFSPIELRQLVTALETC